MINICSEVDQYLRTAIIRCANGDDDAMPLLNELTELSRDEVDVVVRKLEQDRYVGSSLRRRS